MKNPTKILFIDDEEIYPLCAQVSFKNLEIKNPIVTAKNGEEAMDMLKGRNGFQKITPVPKLILLDLNMPKMNGFTFLKELRSDSEFMATIIYVVTSSKNDNDLYDDYKYNIAG
ncbi:MAG: CheY-like chemotaxis protein [Sphingobacteriales bacterium]|jgi:CheY-like chemotaxis protein